MDRRATVEQIMPPIPPDDLPDDIAEALAEADVEAGRIVPHALVREWLKTLGTPDQQPTPYSTSVSPAKAGAQVKPTSRSR